MILEEFKGFVFSLLYTLEKSLLQIIDFIRDIFYRLSGVEMVEIDGSENEILTYFISSEDVKKAYLLILMVGVILLFVFSIAAILKTEKEERKRNRGEIIVKAVRGFIVLVGAPFIVLFLVSLSNAVLISLNSAMGGNLNSKLPLIGGEIFVTSAYDAFIGEESIRDFIESKFIYGDLSYLDLSDVEMYYDIENINYFVGIIGGFIILIMFSLSSIAFIQRLFDVILLYLISPIFIATIPLDDEYRYSALKDIFISKLISQYGIILSMNLFFLIIPKINEITFFESGFKDGIVHLLFLIGGAYAVTKANSVIGYLTKSNMDSNSTYELIRTLRGGFFTSKSMILSSMHLIKKGERSIYKVSEKVRNVEKIHDNKKEIILRNNGKNNKQ